MPAFIPARGKEPFSWMMVKGRRNTGPEAVDSLPGQGHSPPRWTVTLTIPPWLDLTLVFYVMSIAPSGVTWMVESMAPGMVLAGSSPCGTMACFKGY